jgi:Holliday junction DNA helicase RuvB
VGPTKPSNLAACCSRCHTLIHDNLIFVRGEAPHGLEITGPDGEPLGRSRKQIGKRIRKMKGDAKFAEVSGCGGTLPSVTFASLPASADAAWHARHAHLFKWNDMRGEYVFEAGDPVESIADDSGSQRLALDQGGQPIRLETLIGQERVVRSIGIAIEASRVRGSQLDHLLLLGEAGLGKSTLAKAIGNELGTRVATTSGPLIKDASVLIRILCSLACGQVLFIDEIHGLPRPVMECLYEAMEDGVLRLPVTDGHRSKTIEFRLNPFTLIGATTELGKLPGPFLSRFTVREHLESLSLGDLAQIAKRAIARTPLEIDLETATEVAKLAHGIPLTTYGIDERGLDSIAQKALAALERNGRGWPMGISRWAAASGLCAAVLRQSEVELLRLGLVAVTSRGRMAIRRWGDDAKRTG